MKVLKLLPQRRFSSRSRTSNNESSASGLRNLLSFARLTDLQHSSHTRSGGGGGDDDRTKLNDYPLIDTEASGKKQFRREGRHIPLAAKMAGPGNGGGEPGYGKSYYLSQSTANFQKLGSVNDIRDGRENDEEFSPSPPPPPPPPAGAIIVIKGVTVRNEVAPRRDE